LKKIKFKNKKPIEPLNQRNQLKKKMIEGKKTRTKTKKSNGPQPIARHAGAMVARTCAGVK
jgi:hypothetical protein